MSNVEGAGCEKPDYMHFLFLNVYILSYDIVHDINLAITTHLLMKRYICTLLTHNYSGRIHVHVHCLHVHYLFLSMWEVTSDSPYIIIVVEYMCM